MESNHTPNDLWTPPEPQQDPMRRRQRRIDRALLFGFLVLVIVLIGILLWRSGFQIPQTVTLYELEFRIPGNWTHTRFINGQADNPNLSRSAQSTFRQLRRDFDDLGYTEWMALREWGNESIVAMALRYQPLDTHHGIETAGDLVAFLHEVAGVSLFTGRSRLVEDTIWENPQGLTITRYLYTGQLNNLNAHIWLIGVDGEVAHYFLFLVSDSAHFDQHEASITALIDRL